ncbi:MAG: hypothetical protein LC689_22755, partial [Myxococcales bacterium]|nr:hypothetical protein [Myxococcales bacterium]
MLLALSLSACRGSVPVEFGPRPEILNPAGGPRLVETEVSIQGNGFFARGVQSLSAHGGIKEDDGYAASLDGVALLSVRRISETELRAVVPAGLPAGPHALNVVGPYGLSGTLPNAWLASDLSASRLSAAITVPAQVSTGQQFETSLEVRNDGGATASVVRPTAIAAAGVEVRAAPDAQDVPGGESRTFRWTLLALEPGMVSIEAAAAGVDSVSKRPVDAAPSAGQTRVQLRSALRAEADGPAQAQVSVGQTVHFTLEATNTGEAAALSVAVPPPQGASPALQLLAGASPQDVAGSFDQRAFDFTYLAAQPGEAALSASGAGVDENDGEPVAVGTVTWPRIVVQSPPALVLSAATTPAQVSVGQAAAIALTADNRGQAAAGAVQATLRQTGSGAVNVVSAPGAADIAGGASALFSWTLVAAAPGALTFSVDAAGADVNSGAPVLASSGAGSLLVQTPPSLSATASAAPASVSTGQPLQLQLDVTNAGQATAVSVLPDPPSANPSAHLLQGPAAQDIPGNGATRSFVWTYSIDAAGTVAFTVSAAGFDQNSGARVSAAPAVSNDVSVAAAAFLQASATVDRSQASVGQNVTLTMTVANVGQVDAIGVGGTASLSGTGAATLLSSPVAQNIPAQTSRTFQWTWQTTAAGSLAFSADAAGSDANSAATVSASASAGPTQVQIPSALSAALAIAPSVVDTGDPATITMTVSNSGEATAQAVTPTLNVAGSGATLISGPNPASAAIAGNTSQPFTWSYKGSLPGTLTFSGGAGGSDVNTAQAVSATATAQNLTVLAPAALSLAWTTPAAVNVGQPFQATLTATNSGDSAANGATPSV